VVTKHGMHATAACNKTTHQQVGYLDEVDCMEAFAGVCAGVGSESEAPKLISILGAPLFRTTALARVTAARDK
jgi:hypothetical protein